MFPNRGRNFPEYVQVTDLKAELHASLQVTRCTTAAARSSTARANPTTRSAYGARIRTAADTFRE
jgi:hypothetical protein